MGGRVPIGGWEGRDNDGKQFPRSQRFPGPNIRRDQWAGAPGGWNKRRGGTAEGIPGGKGGIDKKLSFPTVAAPPGGSATTAGRNSHARDGSQAQKYDGISGREPLAGGIRKREERRSRSQEGRAGLIEKKIFSHGCSPRWTVAALPRTVAGSHQPIKRLDPGQWTRGEEGWGG